MSKSDNIFPYYKVVHHLNDFWISFVIRFTKMNDDSSRGIIVHEKCPSFNFMGSMLKEIGHI